MHAKSQQSRVVRFTEARDKKCNGKRTQCQAAHRVAQKRVHHTCKMQVGGLTSGMHRWQGRRESGESASNVGSFCCTRRDVQESLNGTCGTRLAQGPNDGCSQQGWQLRMQLVDWRVQPGRLLPKRVPVILKFAQLPQICPAAVSSLLSTSCSWASRLAACPFAAAAAAHAAAPPASRPALPCG